MDNCPAAPFWMELGIVRLVRVDTKAGGVSWGLLFFLAWTCLSYFYLLSFYSSVLLQCIFRMLLVILCFQRWMPILRFKFFFSLCMPRPSDKALVSWNVKGLGHAIKREKVFRHLKSLSADVIFLQETHIKTTEQCRLRCSWISQVYQSPFTSHARGVAILFRKSITFKLSSMVTDPYGRYIIYLEP